MRSMLLFLLFYYVLHRKPPCLSQVDGIKNPKVQSVFFEDMPVHRASFANGGAQVLLAPQSQPQGKRRSLPVDVDKAQRC